MRKEWCDPSLVYHTQSVEHACGPYAAFLARRDLLERLKGEGVRVRDDKLKTWGAAGAEMANKHTGPGWLVWIPEGE